MRWLVTPPLRIISAGQFEIKPFTGRAGQQKVGGFRLRLNDEWYVGVRKEW